MLSEELLMPIAPTGKGMVPTALILVYSLSVETGGGSTSTANAPCSRLHGLSESCKFNFRKGRKQTRI